jgi:hypothetical protein
VAVVFVTAAIEPVEAGRSKSVFAALPSFDSSVEPSPSSSILLLLAIMPQGVRLHILIQLVMMTQSRQFSLRMVHLLLHQLKPVVPILLELLMSNCLP